MFKYDKYKYMYRYERTDGYMIDIIINHTPERILEFWLSNSETKNKELVISCNDRELGYSVCPEDAEKILNDKSSIVAQAIEKSIYKLNRKTQDLAYT